MVREAVSFTDEATKYYMKKAEDKVTPEIWKHCCEHTVKLTSEHARELPGTLSREPHRPVQFVVEPSDDSDNDPLAGVDSDDVDVMPTIPPIKSPNKRTIDCLMKDITKVSVTGRYNTFVPVSGDLDIIVFYFVF